MVTRLSRWLAVALVTVALVIAAAPAVLAHPLGNFTSNTFARLRVQPQHIAIDYILDLAEIPALQTVQREDGDGDGTLGRAERRGFAQRRCDELTAGLRLTAGDRTVVLAATAADVRLPPGEAGLRTLRLECTVRSERLDTLDGAAVQFSDGNLADRVGWREVIAVADGRGIATADVPSASISDALRAYPEDRLSSPLDQTTATLTPEGAAVVDDAAARPAAPVAAPGRLERVTTAFTTAVSARDLTPSFALLAVAIALFLGALHAVAPGHGKTVMAAYLVGRRGTRREALLLGGTVAVTHTAGVLLLGLVVSATQSLAPERLYPVLGAASGVLFAIVGATMLRQALSTRRRKGHHHHHHHDHTHEADAASARRGVGWRALVLPGLAGGLVPTPSALVVLLGGIAIGRAWFGVTLVVMYGVGMAATLVGAGYLLLRARGRLELRSSGGVGRFAAVTAALPVITAAVVTVGGVVIAARSVVAA